ncbi:MAG: radical SAM protein [Planctomycetota bacterium]|nr:radical SAM protein [Planctomycetota bacterium]MDE2217091.1 radical SAM protein [Planctomycetota bacterium]
MQIGFVERKGHVLTRSTLKCLKQVASINPTLGCIHQCAYCYARGYLNYPGDGKVFIYENIVEKLKKELSIRRKLPAYVFFSPTCDVLQPIPQLLNVTYELMRILFEHGIGINLLTKGQIPREFLQLFRQYKKFVHVQIGITTLDNDIQKKIEPYASTPQERIQNIERLCAIGILPEVKLDPLIPSITDTKVNLMTLFKVLQEFSLTSVSINYLFLRLQIKKNLYKALRKVYFLPKIMEYYQKGTSLNLLAEQSRVLALNVQYRKRAYAQIPKWAKAFGLYAYVCGCKNPDITEEPLCGTNWGQHFEKTVRQKHLFQGNN